MDGPKTARNGVRRQGCEAWGRGPLLHPHQRQFQHSRSLSVSMLAREPVGCSLLGRVCFRGRCRSYSPSRSCSMKTTTQTSKQSVDRHSLFLSLLLAQTYSRTPHELECFVIDRRPSTFVEAARRYSSIREPHSYDTSSNSRYLSDKLRSVAIDKQPLTCIRQSPYQTSQNPDRRLARLKCLTIQDQCSDYYGFRCNLIACLFSGSKRALSRSGRVLSLSLRSSRPKKRSCSP